jgi:hypothetical protein
VQAPAPLQVAGFVCVIPEQLWFRQAVAVLQNRHLPVPSHAPSSPQVVLVVAVQRAFGSEPPFATGVQVPTEPLTLQLWQVPVLASEQVVLQQTPSVQFPLVHCGPVLQAEPLIRVPQELLLQVLGLTQSESAVQVVLQVAVGVLQAYLPQLWLTWAGQPSLRPSQNDAST